MLTEIDIVAPAHSGFISSVAAERFAAKDEHKTETRRT